MTGISNYEPNETLATGFVKPKVTSLFFDKIWVPKSLLQTSYEYFIPNQVLIQEEKELVVRGRGKAGQLYDMSIVRNTFPSAGELYNFFSMVNQGPTMENMDGTSKSDVHTEKNISRDFDGYKFKYSKNRNNAIMINSENFCRKYGIHISPIYHNLTEFERDIVNLDVERIYNSNSLRFRIKRSNTFENKNAFSICIQDFPSIIEEELSWEQVLDIRNDKKRIEQLKRFTTWSKRVLTDRSPNEIREILESELYSYKEALKEHGIKTATSGFSTIVSATSSIATLMSNPSFLSLPMLSIVAITIGFSVNTYFSNLKNRNNPIAYLYDLGEL